ncbi:uncharacterized protein LOC114336305 [Diabrotica virgifera virgifera]|uniref:Uncharacterized protein LOC114336305 n=1 Tax=Diabrotica virgifera virgifera TaxID=50390 RepID=A0A6P7G0N7_DIAVI|nr:uncharacterized protein LOC114336305 [Diabrotica virgifera virgifera]
MASKNQPTKKATQEVQINIAVKQQKVTTGPAKTQNKTQVKLDVGNAAPKPRRAPQPRAQPGLPPIFKQDQAVLLQQQQMIIQQQTLMLQQQNIIAAQQMLANTSVAQVPKKQPGRPRVNNNASGDKPKAAPKAANPRTKQQVKVNVKINNNQ